MAKIPFGSLCTSNFGIKCESLANAAPCAFRKPSIPTRSTRRITPRNAAALALVGWYLMAPAILLTVTLIPAKWMARQAEGAP